MSITFPFTANSQDEFDAAIKDRLAREAKKYEGFDAYKTKAAEYDSLIAKDYEGQLKAANESLKKAQDQMAQMEESAKSKSDIDAQSIAELTSKLAAAELANTRTRVAISTGLPYELADHLRGSTEDELLADAKIMAPFLSKQPAPPIGGNDPSPSQGSKSPRAFSGEVSEQEEYAIIGRLTDQLVGLQ